MDAPSPAPSPAPAPAARRRRVALRVLSALLIGALVCTALAVGLVFWAARSEAGMRALLSFAPGVRVSAPSGTLLGDFTAERVEITLPGDGTVVLTQPRWRGLRLERLASAPWGWRLSIDELEASRVQLRPGAASANDPPPVALRDATLPVGVEVAALRVGEFNLLGRTLAPVRDLRARLRFAGGPGSHRIEGLQLLWDRLRLDGSVSLGAQAPLSLQASVALAEIAAPGTTASAPQRGAAASTPEAGFGGWTAQLAADGPLERFALTAALRASRQRLDAHADVTPFAPLPVSRVDAHTEALDLSALVSNAPKTSLSGRLRAWLAETSGAALPLTIQADLRNAAAGLWDAGRLPVRRLEFDAQGAATDTTRGELRSFVVELGSAALPSGALRGSGRWEGERWWLDAALDDVAPSALDRRAPPLVVAGTVQLRGVGGLPAPAPAPTPAAPASGVAPVSVDATAKLRGRLVSPKGSRATGVQAAAWQLDLEGAGHANEVTVRRLEASSAGASARVHGHARRTEGTPAAWQLRGEATLVNVNPNLLPEAARLKGGASRLNGEARFDLLLPERPPTGSGLTPWLAAWRGSANASVRESQLAGVPLSGELQLNSAGRAGVRVTASMAAAGNRFALHGELDAQSAEGTGDRWTVEAAAPALAALAPALRLFRPDVALSGALTANAEVSGRWPVLASRGELAAESLALPGLALDGAQARWNLSTAPNGPALLQFRARHLAIGDQRLESPHLQVEGTGNNHVARLRVETVPPAPATGSRRVSATPGAQGASAPVGTSAQGPSSAAAQRLAALVEAQGGWSRDVGTATLGWRGRIRQLEVQAIPAADTAAAGAAQAQTGTSWLSAQPFDLSWSSGTTEQRLNVSPTRLLVLDTPLRLRQLSYAATKGQATQVDVQAELEPLAVAPLLARLQPQFGWGGNLTVAGRFNLRSGTDGVVADAVLERTAGDLHVTDPSLVPTVAPGTAAASAVLAASAPASAARSTVRGVTQRLGLSDARLALSARDGVWRFSQHLQGRNLGRLVGDQTVRSDARATWPPADAALDGRLDVQVDNLSTWGGWVPAGWRLVGQLAVNARVGGRFGAPEYTGRLTGSGLGARHLLAGVDVRDGEVAIALEGPTARIERLVLHGGEGTVRVDGRAEFGQTPRAQVKLVADHFGLLGRVDRKVVTSGQAQLNLESDALKLEGRFVADEGLIDISSSGAPSVSDDVTIVGREDEEEAEAGTGAPRRNVSINLAIDLGQQFRVRGRGLDTLLRGSLTITAPGGRPYVVGVIRTEGGTFNAYAQKLTIERGSISFTGPVDNPRLDILALRAQSATASETDVKVGVSVTGPALSPRVRLYSVPEMSETEKLSWLVLGRGATDLGTTEVALVQQAALALLAGESGDGKDDILKRIGLDELSIRQSDGEVRETVVAVGKQISDRWYVGYERTVSATSGSWQLIYRVARRFTLRAQSGDENSLDAIWTWRWQ